MTSKPKPAYENINLQQQSVVNADSSRRSPLTSTYYPKIATTWENFLRPVELYPNNRCYGVRYLKNPKLPDFGPYEWLSYSQIYSRVRDVSAGFAALGLCRQQKIGIWSKNSLPWMLVDLAAASRSMVTVAIYDTFGPSVVEYVLNHAEIRIVFCSDVTQIRTLLGVMGKLPELRIAVLLNGEVTPELLMEAGLLLRVMSLGELMTLGKQYLAGNDPMCFDPPGANDLAVIMYTSGTTGMPKGVMQTHANIISMCSAIQTYINLEPNDSYLSYLPLAHIFERCAMACFIGAGASIGFSCGVITKLVEDIGELKPSIFLGVPRVFDRIRQGVTEKVSKENRFKQWLFNYAYESKKQSGKSAFWDAVVFKKIRERLGGRIRFVVAGGAPLSAATQQFMQICFCCPVMQGYGLTESTAGGTLSNPCDTNVAHVGAPIPGVDILLIDVPEMGYSAAQGTGEVCIRGPCVSPGYYKDPQLTAHDFFNGWFHTGDIGKWNSNGTLSIIDRKKNIFKLSIGEYIAAERLEGIYSKSCYSGQVWVYGDSERSCIVAVVVPNKSALMSWATERKIPDSFEELCNNPNAIKAVYDDLHRIGKEAKLQSFELVQAIHLRPKEFTIEEDLLTPTMKLRRNNLVKSFRAEIDRMYANIATNSDKAKARA